ncbi:MAG: hypothetical protein ABR557_07760 [Pyrinomonadaceae bacterium]
MNALENYLEELYATRNSGGAVKETSYYPALSNLLNEVGKIEVKSTGEEVKNIAGSEQVMRYVNRYKQGAGNKLTRLCAGGHRPRRQGHKP